jgi:hypothetical protein
MASRPAPSNAFGRTQVDSDDDSDDDSDIDRMTAVQYIRRQLHEIAKYCTLCGRIALAKRQFVNARRFQVAAELLGGRNPDWTGAELMLDPDRPPI